MSVIVTTNRRGFPVHDIIHVHPNDVQRFGVKHVLREAELHIVASVSYAAECLAAMKSYPNAVVLTEIVFGGTLIVSWAVALALGSVPLGSGALGPRALGPGALGGTPRSPHPTPAAWRPLRRTLCGHPPARTRP